MSHLALVPEDRSEWFRCRPWIEAALEYTGGTHMIEDIEQGIAERRYHFFSSRKSAVVVEILSYPRFDVLNYFLIGGDLQDLIENIEPYVSKWAREQLGCKKAIGIGRKGFERAFRSSGYEPAWTAIVRELT